MAYVDYAAAWGDNERELAAMSPPTRRAFLQEFEKRVAPLVTEDGLLVEVEHYFYQSVK